MDAIKKSRSYHSTYRTTPSRSTYSSSGTSCERSFTMYVHHPHLPAPSLMMSCAQKFSNVDFFLPLIETMTCHDPKSRPDATEAQRQWHQIRSQVNVVERIWRLRPRDEPYGASVIFDGFALLRSGVHWSGRMMGAYRSG